jgi:(1->4)-alpha-D-glucan 1-alpha-D-glucosylmutase
VALNEVGGSPGRFGVSVEEFHRANEARAADWPNSMLTTSTHDTKRSEDVRARIALLSEIPGRFEEEVIRWSAINERHRHGDLPDRNAEWLFYQTVVGAWPLPVERALAYMQKASKEAKAHTSWVDPDAAYDEALRAFVEGALGDPEFNAALERFAAGLVVPGRVNSLAQTLLKLTAPGVPDLYQGSELWDLSLVDPDNRRPVDFAARREMLARIDDGWLPPVDESGAAKLLVTSRTLRLRRQRPELFGGYRPVFAEGRVGDHVLAFDRGGVVAVATRLPVGLARHGGWHDTAVSLDGHSFTDVFTGTGYGGSRLAVADLLHTYPVALLVKES